MIVWPDILSSLLQIDLYLNLLLVLQISGINYLPEYMGFLKVDVACL